MEELFYLFQKLVKDFLEGKEETIILFRGGQLSGEWKIKTKEAVKFMAECRNRFSLAVVLHEYGEKLPIRPLT